MSPMVTTPKLKRAAQACLLACALLVLGAPLAAQAESYQDGRSGHSFLSWRGSVDTRTGYTGASGSINRPHRSDWLRKLREQRRYEEYVREQNARQSTAACGFTGAPSYCYKLITKPRYPAEYRVVRY